MTDKEYLELYRKSPEYEKYDGWEEDFQKLQDYNKELVEKYPFLLPRNRWTGEVLEDYDYSYTELDSMPDGWRIAFGIQMCDEIAQELRKFNYIDEYRITQIKEKYGTLRWYDFGAPIGKLSDVIGEVVKDNSGYPEHKDNEYFSYEGQREDGKYVYSKRIILEKCRVFDIVNKYEKLSWHTCICCGKESAWATTDWISPYCKDCANDFYKNYKKHRPEFEWDDFFERIEPNE